MNKNLGITIFAFLVVLLPLKYVRADAAPDPPQCAGGYSVSDGNGGYVPVPTTCGFLYLDANLDLGQYADKFLLLLKKTIRGVSVWSLANNDSNMGWSFASKGSGDLLAVDKDYFTARGGVDDLFVTTTIDLGDPFGVENTMVPKNQDDLYAHAYQFLVSKDDSLLTMTEGGISVPSTTINGQYILLPDSNAYPYATTSDIGCNDYNVCHEDVTYVPQSIVRDASTTYFALTVGKVTYTPSSAGQSVTYPIYNQTSTPDQNQVQSQPVVNQQLNWWQQFWNWLTHIF